MMKQKKQCRFCHKLKRVHDATTYEDYGGCSTCVTRMNLEDLPLARQPFSLTIEVTPYDLYMEKAVNKYADQGFRGIL